MPHDPQLEDLLHEMYCLVSTYALMEEYPNERERCEADILATAESIKDMDVPSDSDIQAKLAILCAVSVPGDMQVVAEDFRKELKLAAMRSLHDYYMGHYYEPPEPVERA